MADTGKPGAMPPDDRRDVFCSAKTFQDKRADSSGCDNAKRRSASGGFRPVTPDQGLCPEPRCASVPDPRYRFASALTM